MEKTQSNSNQIINQTKQNQNVSQEEQLMDFSSMFKKNAVISKPKLGQKSLKAQTPNWLLQIPAKIQTTKEDLFERKVLDMRRWMSIVKGNNTQLLLSTVISIWNYLNSNIGLGKQKMLTLEQFKALFNSYEMYQQTASNEQKIKMTLSIIKLISDYFKTPQMKYEIISLSQQSQSQQSLSSILTGIKSNKVYIYFAYGRILCPIGYEITPLIPLDAYKKLEDIQKKNQQLWIIMSQCCAQQRSFMIKRWKDIELQLKSEWPQFVDLDQTKKGRQKYSQQTQTDTQLKQTQTDTQLKRQKSFMLSFWC